MAPITREDFERIPSDANGNPRYVVHYFTCEPESWKNDDPKFRYVNTCKLMNKIGGSKYHNTKFGGGIAFCTYSIPETIAAIEKLTASK